MKEKHLHDRISEDVTATLDRGFATHVWNRLGDHPDDLMMFGINPVTGEDSVHIINAVVDRVGEEDAVAECCKHCGKGRKEHGVLRSMQGMPVVCPGDIIVKTTDTEGCCKYMPFHGVQDFLAFVNRYYKG